MDFSKASKQQLYEIATDENARLKERYAAALELNERRKKDAQVYRNRPQYKNRFRRT